MASKHAHPEDALAELLRVSATWAALSRVLEQALRGSGVSLEQGLALLTIRYGPRPLRLSGLAACMSTQAQSITSLMDRLERDGWAERVYHGLLDRRIILVELTEAGRTKCDEVEKVLGIAAGQVEQAVGVTERERLGGVLEALSDVCESQSELRLPSLPKAARGEERSTSVSVQDGQPGR